MTEQWLLIPSFPDYEISESGLIRRARGVRGHEAGKAVQTQERSDGRAYRSVGLSRSGRKFYRQVHVLVAEAFIGERPNGYEVNHKDFDPSNNHWSNLEYVTHAENCRHSRLAGRYTLPPNSKGENNAAAKVTEGLVREIRSLFAAGAKRRELAARFGIGRTQISNIVTRRRWAHVA